MIRNLYSVVRSRHSLSETECTFIKMRIKKTFAQARKNLVDSHRNGNRKRYERKLRLDEDS